MTRFAFPIATVLLTAAACALAQQSQPAQTPQSPSASTPPRPATPPTPPAPPVANAAAANAPAYTGPVIVVHTDRAPADARDSRVELGNGMRISSPSWATAPSPARTDGTIAVPDNTLGPGEPMWKQRERDDAERKLAQAQAEYAQEVADRSEREFDRNDRYSVFNYYPSFRHGGFYPHYTAPIGGWRSGPRGPVTHTVTRFNDLGSEAQRNFSDAAYPRNQFEIDEARSRAIRQFGRDSEPRIIEQQRARDEAHRNANRNTFKPPTTTEPVPAPTPSDPK